MKKTWIIVLICVIALYVFISTGSHTDSTNSRIVRELNSYLETNYSYEEFDIQECEYEPSACFGSGASLARENDDVEVYELISPENSRRLGLILKEEYRAYYVSLNERAM